METGLAVYEALTRSGRVLLEVYPYAGFRQLAGGPLPRKTTAAGRTQRVTLLRSAGVRRGHLKLWSHDSIDALLGALVARQYADGKALKATCGHDDSAIWLP
jgi:predicted nuclease with RNAse H fold